LRTGSNESGYSLVELLIVLALIMTLAAIGIPLYRDVIGRAQVAKAIGDISVLSAEITNYFTGEGSMPETLADIRRDQLTDPYGSPYAYAPIYGAPTKGGGNGNGKGGGSGKPKGSFRKDRWLHPLNSDFDLYSVGADGRSVLSLSAKMSHDDIVRANDGGFIGLAKDY